MNMIRGLLVFVAFRIAHSEITTSPVNATARACEAANFTCAGIGDFLNWNFDGLPANSANNAGRNLVESTVIDGQNISSTLTVPASNGNDNEPIQCVVFNIMGNLVVDTSPTTYLSIEGPGQVADLVMMNLTASSVCIGWKQPYMCYNGMDSFEYHVSVEAIDSDEASTVTVSERSYCSPIDPCGRYTVTVTPSVQSYNGTSKSLLVNGLDDFYNIEDFDATNVIFESEDSCNVSFQIQAASSDLVCPNRSLLVMIENTTVYSMAINSSSNNISFTVTGLETEKWLTAIAKIVDTSANKVLNQSQINVSTFSLQGFTSDLIENRGSQIFLFVQCEFAQGSSTMGCHIVVDVYGSSLNHTVLKQGESDIALANISVPIACCTSSGGVIQLTAYSISANGDIIQNVLPLTQLISVPPVSATSQPVPPTSAPSATTTSSFVRTTSGSSSPPSLSPTMGVVTDMDPFDYVPVVVAILVIAVAVAVVGLFAIIFVYLLRRRRKSGENEVSLFSRKLSNSNSSPVPIQVKEYVALEASLSNTEARFTRRSDTDPLLSGSGELEPSSAPPLTPPAVEPPVFERFRTETDSAAAADPSPARPLTPPAIKAPVYEETLKFSQRSKEKDLSSATDASPVTEPPGIKAPVYEETFKFSPRSKDAESSPASNVSGIHYAEVKPPEMRIPNIREPSVVYTKFKGQRTYENRMHVGITPDPPPPLPAKRSKLQSQADNHDSVQPSVLHAEVPPEDSSLSHCDPAAESPVGTSVKTSDNHVPENVQKYEETVAVAGDCSLSDPVAESPSVLTSTKTSLTRSHVLAEEHKLEEILPANTYHSLTCSDPVAESVRSAETSFTGVSVEEQNCEGEVPQSTMVVPGVVPQITSTGSVSVGLNYEGSALKSDIDDYAVHEHEEVSSSSGPGRSEMVFINLRGSKPSATLPAGLLYPVTEANPSRDSSVCATGMGPTSDYQERALKTEPAGGDTKDSGENWLKSWESLARFVKLSEDKIEDIRNSSNTDQERMERVVQLIRK